MGYAKEVFNLWNPLLTATECELDVTPAECFAMGRGTRELMTSFLSAWGITGAVDEWAVEPLRSSYFSDYLDSGDWRDRWQRVWHVRVRGAFVCPPEPRPFESLKYVRETDSTSDNEDEGAERDSCRALLIVGAREARESLESVTVPRVKDLLSSQGMKIERVELTIRHVVAGQPEPTEEMRSFIRMMSSAVATSTFAKLERAAKPLHQLRVLISGTEFPEDEAALSKLCCSMKESGYFVHRHALEFDALTPTGKG